MLLETCLYHSVGTIPIFAISVISRMTPVICMASWWQLLELLLVGDKSGFAILEGLLRVRLGSHLNIMPQYFKSTYGTVCL
jgi:hypothetical protein